MYRYLYENLKGLIMSLCSSCHQTNAEWYLGKDCRFQVNKVGLYAGLGTVAAIAVITIAILTVYLVRNKRVVKR